MFTVLSAFSSHDQYVNAVKVCNSLAQLASQNSLVKNVQRITLLLKLQQCWNKDHGNVHLICSCIEHDCSKSDIVKWENEISENSVNDDDDTSSVDTAVDGLKQSRDQHLSRHLNLALSENKSFEQRKTIQVKHDCEQQLEINETVSTSGKCIDSIEDEEEDNVLFLSSPESVTPRIEVKLPSSPLSATVLTNKRTGRRSSVTYVIKRKSTGDCDNNFKSRKSKVSSKITVQQKVEPNLLEVNVAVRPASVCPFCGRQFKKPSWLQRHLVTHTGERPYACRHPGCDKRFGQSSTRNFHESSHSETRPFVCGQCGYSFKSAISLRLHSRNVHASADVIAHRRRLECVACGRLFKTAGRMRVHTRLVHDDERLFACETCAKRFKTRTQLDRHRLALHSDERPWQCKVCGKGFAQAGNMKTHMRTHTGEKPFVCAQCGCRFAHSGTLKSHVATHKTENEQDTN